MGSLWSEYIPEFPVCSPEIQFVYPDVSVPLIYSVYVYVATLQYSHYSLLLPLPTQEFQPPQLLGTSDLSHLTILLNAALHLLQIQCRVRSIPTLTSPSLPSHHQDSCQHKASHLVTVQFWCG